MQSTSLLMFSSLCGKVHQGWPYKRIIFHFYEKSLSTKEIAWLEELWLYLSKFIFNWDSTGELKKKKKKINTSY